MGRRNICFDTIRLFLRAYAKDRVYADKSLTLEPQHSSSYGRDTAQYVLKYNRKLPQNNTTHESHLNDVVLHT